MAWLLGRCAVAGTAVQPSKIKLKIDSRTLPGPGPISAGPRVVFISAAPNKSDDTSADAPGGAWIALGAACASIDVSWISGTPGLVFPKSRQYIHHPGSGRGPAGALPGSGSRYLCGFYQVRQLLRPPRRCAVAGAAALPDKNQFKINSWTPAGPRPDIGRAPGGVCITGSHFL